VFEIALANRRSANTRGAGDGADERLPDRRRIGIAVERRNADDLAVLDGDVVYAPVR
jgi:hypothetical protein